MKGTRVTLEDIEQSTDQLPLVGYTVFWSLAGIRVKHDDLKAALDATGLSRYCPDPPTPYMAIKRAIESWRVQRMVDVLGGREEEQARDESEGAKAQPSGGKKQRVLIRAVPDQDWVVFALVREAIVNLGLSHATTLRVLYNKKSQTLFCSTDPAGIPVGDAFEEALKRDELLTRELITHWSNFRDLHVAGDLTDMMVGMLHSFQGVTLRPKLGSTYFVPEGHRDGLTRMSQMLRMLPTNGVDQPFLCALGVIDRGGATRQLARAVHESLMAEVDGLHNDLKRFTSANGTVKTKTMEERLQAYADLRKKVEIYVDLMGMRSDRILAKLGSLREQAKKVMIGDVGAASNTAEAAESQIPLWTGVPPAVPVLVASEVA